MPYTYYSVQNPKLSNKELVSGSSKTLGGALCPPDFISNANLDIGRSATTSEDLLRRIERGSGLSRSLKFTGVGSKNSQLRTFTR